MVTSKLTREKTVNEISFINKHANIMPKLM